MANRRWPKTACICRFHGSSLTVAESRERGPARPGWPAVGQPYADAMARASVTAVRGTAIFKPAAAADR